ncbi:MAG TPA: 2-alkenal reductase, partial [Segeticoccus sp.]|nr:2-alkenal reductase [Segeticoccus sp.]
MTISEPSVGGGNGKGSGNGRRSQWLAVPVAAVLAAALASGGTYAWTHNDTTTPAGQTSSSQTNSNGSSNQAAPPVTNAADAAPNWSAVAQKVTPSVVAITVSNGSSGDQGSGVIWDTKGRIVTNNHVVASAKQGANIRVTLNDSRTYTAHLVGT